MITRPDLFWFIIPVVSEPGVTEYTNRYILKFRNNIKITFHSDI